MVSILAAGDNVADCYTEMNRMFPGGNAVNVAVFARHAGAETTYLGTVGTDAAGEMVRRALTVEGVSSDLVRVTSGETGYCLIGHVAGDRVFLESCPGVSRAPLDPPLLSAAANFDAVHTGQSSGLDAYVARLSAVSLLSYDFATYHDRAQLEAIAPHCYLASFSGGSLSLSGSRELARSAVQRGSTWALVTRGGAGAVLMSRETSLEAPAHPAKVVDTLGAGDTFIARILVGLLRRESPDAALADAAFRAAQTCSRVGAFGTGAPLHINHPAAAMAPGAYLAQSANMRRKT